MKVNINEKIFSKMLDATKNGIEKIGSRSELQYIRLKVESGKITAMVCNGYSGARFKFDAENHEGEDFNCLIKPIPFKASRIGNLTVSLELIDGDVLLCVPTEYGSLTYHFKQNFEIHTKLDSIFDAMKEHDREIALNSVEMARIMSNFAKVTEERNKPVIIETKDSKTKGIRMIATGENFEFEQFLLPLRMDKANNA